MHGTLKPRSQGLHFLLRIGENLVKSYCLLLNIGRFTVQLLLSPARVYDQSQP